MQLPNMPELKDGKDYTSKDKLEYVFSFILEYTGPFYRMLKYSNKSMKQNYETLFSKEYPDNLSIDEVSRFTDEFIKASMVWPGTIYRGVNVNKADIDNYLADLENVTMGGISSWTTSLPVACLYSYGEKDIEIVYILENKKHAANIAHLSMFYSEAEVIAPSTAVYRIINTEDKSTPDKKTYYVYIEEI